MGNATAGTVPPVPPALPPPWFGVYFRPSRRRPWALIGEAATEPEALTLMFSMMPTPRPNV